MTKSIVKTSTDISKLNEEMKTALFKANVSGLEDVTDSNRIEFPLEISIVQKLTGDALFNNPEDNNRKNWGKMFIRPKKVKNAEGNYEYESKLTASDLKGEMELILLRVEFGVEIWQLEEKEGLDFPIKVVKGRSKSIISPKEREDWLANYNPDNHEKGLRYTNQVRLVMTPYSYKDVVEYAEEGTNPFVTITLSGTDGWNTWGVINNGMTNVKKQLGVKGMVKDMLASCFKIKLTTVETEQGGNNYFIFNAEVLANDVQEAYRFKELVEMLHDRFTFFNNTDHQDPTLRDIQSSPEQIEDVDVVEEIDDEIPF